MNRDGPGQTTKNVQADVSLHKMHMRRDNFSCCGLYVA